MPGLLRGNIEKIVEVYFAGVTAVPFTYNGKSFRPKEIHVSPHIFRGTTCPMGCGGCCHRFSLTYLPSDPRPDSPFIDESWEEVNGVKGVIFVDTQTDHTDHFCRHLNKKNGLCGIHGTHPFTCDFELIRFTHQDDRVDIATRLFGRGWSYARVTGQTGALCDVLPPSDRAKDDAVRKLKRLQQWADHFLLKTHLPRIIEWVASGPHEEPLHIVPGRMSLLDLIHSDATT